MIIANEVNDFRRLAPNAFVGDVDVIEMNAYEVFTDLYGKESNQVAVSFLLSRATADKSPGIASTHVILGCCSAAAWMECPSIRRSRRPAGTIRPSSNFGPS